MDTMPFDLGIPDFDLGTVSLGLFMETTFFSFLICMHFFCGQASLRSSGNMQDESTKEPWMNRMHLVSFDFCF